MAIPAKKVKADQDGSGAETSNGAVEETKADETAAQIAEAAPVEEAGGFPPQQDAKPEDSVAGSGEAEELVGVKTVQDHACNVGGKSYAFKAGERAMVPFNVKCVLSRANLLRG